MKKVLTLTAFVSLSVFAQVPQVVPAPVDHLFVPKGFDNNDNIELVVTGKFPNPCFASNKVDVKVQGDVVAVTVTALQSEGSGERCEPLKVPFKEVVTVGNLQGGDYKIVVNDTLKDSLMVETSNSQSVDEHLYASVDYVDLGFTGGLSGSAFLVARAVSSCLEFDHVEYVSNGKDTFSVLPIMKKVSDVCPEESRRIDIPIKFDIRSLKSPEVLLFVRSMDGKSVHSMINRD